MSLLKNRKGFTLIELVIVLAIAALILAGVLVAVSGAQKARRDTQTKNNLGDIASYLEQSASNFQGNYPGAANGEAVATFNTNYLASSSLKDPSTGSAYTLTAASGANAGCPWPQAATPPAAGGVVEYLLTGRTYAIAVLLNSGDTYCQSNQ